MNNETESDKTDSRIDNTTPTSGVSSGTNVQQTSEINAKYDAELAELEKQQKNEKPNEPKGKETTVKSDGDISTHKWKIADLTDPNYAAEVIYKGKTYPVVNGKVQNAPEKAQLKGVVSKLNRGAIKDPKNIVRPKRDLIAEAKARAQEDTAETSVELVDGKPVVKGKGSLNEESKRTAIIEATENGLYDNVPRATDGESGFQSDEQVSEHIARESRNPVEVAEELDRLSSQRKSDNHTVITKDEVIAEAIGGGVSVDSYKRNTGLKGKDRPAGLTKSWLSKTGRPLDLVAIDASMEWTKDGDRDAITEEDIVDFMHRNPSVVDFRKGMGITDTEIQLGERFRELTGLPPSKRNIDTFVNAGKTERETEQETQRTQLLLEDEDNQPPFHATVELKDPTPAQKKAAKKILDYVTKIVGAGRIVADAKAYAEKLREVMGKAGTNFHSNKNIQSGLSALKEIAGGKESVQTAMTRNDLKQHGGATEITFDWGKTGDPNKEFKKGFGISHISAKHGTETLIKLLDVIANGKIARFAEGNKTVIISKDGHEAVLALTKNGNKETWLLTGWKTKEESAGANGKVSATSEATQSNPTFSRTDLGAALSDANIQKVLGSEQTRFAAQDYRSSHIAPNAADVPLHDLTMAYGNDIYSNKAYYYFGDGDVNMDKKSAAILQNVKGKPNAKVTVYRAVPKGITEINSGDWVSINKDYAKQHGEAHLDGEYDIISKELRADQIFTDGSSMHEQGVQFLSTPSGEVLGFVADGKIYLDPSKLNPETIAEEFIHLQQQALRLAAEQGDKKAQKIIKAWDKATEKVVDEFIKGAQVGTSKKMSGIAGNLLNLMGITKAEMASGVYKQQHGESAEAYKQRIKDEIWAKAQKKEFAERLEKLADENRLTATGRRIYEALKDFYNYILDITGKDLSLSELIERTNRELSSDKFLKGNPNDTRNNLLSLINQNGTVNYGNVKQLTEEIISGQKSLRSIFVGERAKTTEGEKRIVETTLILEANRRMGGTNVEGSRTSQSEQASHQEQLLKDYAKKEGVWFDEKQARQGTQIPSGKEADVYISEDGKTVTKVVNYKKYSKTPLEFLNNRISLFNKLFPETSYTLKGFTETENGLSFIVEQPRIQGQLLSRVATLNIDLQGQLKRLANYVSDELQMKDAGLDAVGNNLYQVHDLHLKNAIEGTDGKIYVIDAIPKLADQSLDTGIEIIDNSSDVRWSVGGEITLPDGTKKTVRRIAADVVDGFYSPIENAVHGLKQDKGTATQMLQMIKQGKGVKADELQWTGVEEWLSSKGNERVTKQEILDFMKDNRVQLVEVVKGSEDADVEITPEMYNSLFDELKKQDKNFNDSNWKNRNTGEYHDYPSFNYLIEQGFEPTHKIEDFYELLETQTREETKYHEYQLAGERSNYREVLITLPNKDSTNLNLRDWYEKNKIENKKFEDLTDTEYDEISVKWKKEKDSNYLGKFRSSHYSEPNIVGHLRMSDRTDAEGNKVLHLEEMQSDWGQKGKKEGFASEENKKKWDKLEAERQALWDEANKNHNGHPPLELQNKINDVVKKQQEVFNANQNPQAPFVTNTSAWTKLLAKYAIKEAVNSGADKITWTSGETQNDRYDLSKQVDVVYTSRVADNHYNVDIDLKAGHTEPLEIKDGVVTKGLYTGSKLEDVIGKELAEKILNSKGDQEYKGDDLRVGGSGMKGFYGSPTEGRTGIVGKAFQEAVRDITGEKGVKIGETKIEAGETQKQTKDFPANEFKESLAFEKELENKGVKNVVAITNKDGSHIIEWKEATPTTQHSIDITPEIREAVGEGIPMFQLSTQADTTPFNGTSKIKATKEKIQAKYPDAIVVQSESELPQVIQNEIQQQRAEGKVKGVHHKGKVYMVADNIPTMGEAEGTYRHERLGHKGVIDHLGAKLDEFATGVINKSSGRQLERIKNLAKKYGIPFENMTEAQKSQLGQEYIAMIAENKSKMPKQWNDLVRFIRQTLRDMGIKLRVSDTEIQALIGKVEQNKNIEAALDTKQIGNKLMFLTDSDLDANGKPKAEVLREIAVEKAKIKAEAKANGTFMKAPNGKKTNLNEEQWVAVRTERFKKWFGDWEMAAENKFVSDKISKLLKGDNDTSKGSQKETIAKATPEQVKLLKEKTGIDVTGFKHTIDKSNINHAINNHGNAKQEESRGQIAITEDDFGKIPEVLNNPDKIEYSGKNDKGLETIKYTKAFNGTTIVVEEVRTGRKELAFNTMYKRKTGSDSLQKPSVLTSETTSRSKDTKDNEVSKVVDSNGEPLVVYHNTNYNGNEFGRSDRKYTMFTPDKSLFSSKGDRKVAAFLDIRNLKTTGQEIEEDSYDGFVNSTGLIYGVKKPNQIKSATSNAGTYSESNNINFQISDGSDGIKKIIPLRVAKTMIDVMKAVEEVGSGRADKKYIFDQGIWAIKQTDWYDSLTPEQQAEIDTPTFRNALGSLVESLKSNKT